MDVLPESDNVQGARDYVVLDRFESGGLQTFTSMRVDEDGCHITLACLNMSEFAHSIRYCLQTGTERVPGIVGERR